MVILITGKAGAGKTEYGTRLANELHVEGKSVVMLDGDVERDKTQNRDFSDEGRLRNLTSSAELARDLEREGKIVIMAFVSPRKAWRDVMRSYWRVSRVVYIPGGRLWEGTTYERPEDDELDIRRK